jgi:hypothetical protein
VTPAPLAVQPLRAVYVDEAGSLVHDEPPPLYLFRGAVIAFPKDPISYEVVRVARQGDVATVTVRPIEDW